MMVTWQSVVNFLRNVGSVASIVLAAIPQTGLPNSVRAVLVVIGGVVQVVEHWNNTGASTVTPPTPPQPKTGP